MNPTSQDMQAAGTPEFTGEAAQLLAALDFVEPEMKELIPEYKTAALCTAGFLLLLWGLLAAGGIGMVWFTCHQLLSGLGRPLLCVFILFIELTVLVFILKPLIIRRKPASDDTVELYREDEPLLYAFVEKLCVRMNAPVPRSIRVGVDANAAARLDSTVTGKTTLILGLPLAAGLSVRHFTAILAHEFAHFNQKTGLRLGAWLVRSGNFLSRVLYQRDGVDKWLARQCRSGKIWRKIAAWTARIAVEASRGVLWLFLVAGEWMYCHLSRQMEYDADRTSALIAGREELLRTLEVLNFLVIGSAHAQADTNQALRAKALPDDMVSLIVADGISMARYRDKVFEMSRQEQTTWRSTHPSLPERATNLADIRSAGLVTSNIRSTHLFSNFSTVCRRATRAHYEVHLGKAAAGITMIDSRKLAKDQSRRREQAFCVRRYFRTGMGMARMILPDSSWLSPPADPAAAVSTLADLRREVLNFTESIDSRTGKDYEDLLVGRTALRAHVNGVESLIDTAGRMKLPAAVRALHRIRKKLLRSMGTVHAKLEEMEPRIDALDRLSRHRLALCFALSQSPALAKQSEATGKELQQRALELTRRCEALEKCSGLALRMREGSVILCALANTYPDRLRKLFMETVREISGEITASIQEYNREIRTDTQLGKLNAELESVRGRTLQVAVPEASNTAAVLNAVDCVIERFEPIILDAIGQIAILGEDIEAAFKLPPLKETTEATEKRKTEDAREKSAAAAAYWWANGARALGGLTILLGVIWLAAGVSTPQPNAMAVNGPVGLQPLYTGALPPVHFARHNIVPNAPPLSPAPLIAPQPVFIPPAPMASRRPQVRPRPHLPWQRPPNQFPPDRNPPMYELRPVPPGQ